MGADPSIVVTMQFIRLVLGIGVFPLLILVDQWRIVEQAGERTLVVRMTGLVPDSSVWLVQTVHNSVGAQSGVSLTEKITAADGSLRCALPLMEIDGEETMLVLALDSAFCPLRAGWRLSTGGNS